MKLGAATSFFVLMMRISTWLRLLGAGWLAAVSLLAAALPPIGPFTGLTEADFADSRSFGGGDRLVFASYFYWYDVYSGAHLVNPDGSDALTTHPPTVTGFSYRSKAWHRGQLEDMEDAGIDVVLPVYWGEPSQRIPDRPVEQQPWSYSGLLPLVEARDELVAAGRNPPRVGLFYDTSTLEFNAAGRRVDLTTVEGREWFYHSIRDFFSLIPPRHWAMIDGRPVVFLYSASFAVAHDQRCITDLREGFARDFGGRTPFVVREISWAVTADDTYAWGGAVGLKNPGLASLGPGYDHSAVPGREPLVVPRENGAFFERNWLRFLSRPSNRVIIETWNEYHEGTDIARSREYGRQYIDLNRKFVDLFKAGYQPPRPEGPFTGARLTRVELGTTNREAGLVQFESADGVTTAGRLGGWDCRIVAPTSNLGRYVYVRIDDSFKWAERMSVSVVVDYFDAAPGWLQLQFDGSDTNAPFQGAYTTAPERVVLSGSRIWKTAVFHLEGARFQGMQNGGADFRLEFSGEGHGLRQIQVVRPGLQALTHSDRTGTTLRVFGDPGRSYWIDVADRLGLWTVLRQVRLNAVTETVEDSGARDAGLRWYRLRP